MSEYTQIMNNTILYHEEAQRSKNKKNNNNIVNKKYTDYYGVPALIDSIKIKIDITLYYFYAVCILYETHPVLCQLI